MRKIKVNISYDELVAMYADLFNNMMRTMPQQEYWQKAVVAILVKFYMDIAPRTFIKSSKKIKLTISVETACALCEYIHGTNRNPSDYISNFYLRLSREIHQKLS